MAGTSIPALSAPLGEMKDRYTVVVVGSGYGGGIAACRLARAGRDVCVLERGREIRPGEYPKGLVAALGEIQTEVRGHHVGPSTGLFDFRLNDDMNVIVGCGLGGTSLINAGVGLEAPAAVFQSERWPAALRAPGALAEGYARATEMLRPKPLPDDVQPAKLGALSRSAEALGAPCRRAPIYVNFDDRTGGNHVGVPQAGCTLCGDCVTGCNYGAKNTVLMNYLPDAKRHGAEIYTTVSVRRIARDDKGWVVYYRVLGSWDEVLGRPDREIRADVVVLAAGTLGSVEILLRSKKAGLPLSDRLGGRFSGNGDFLALSYDGNMPIHGVGGQPPPDPAPGPTITGYIDRISPAAPEGGLVEDGGIPGALAFAAAQRMALATIAVAADEALQGEQPAAPAAFYAPAPADPREKMMPMDALYAPAPLRAMDMPSPSAASAEGIDANDLLLGALDWKGALDRTQTLIATGFDDSGGQMTMPRDGLVIEWKGVRDLPAFQEQKQTLIEAGRPLDGWFVPLSGLLGTPLLTAHPLGGAVLADDAADGVVDDRGRVFAGPSGSAVHDGLYVMDGSIVPTALGVNPSLTISALAERLAALMIEDRGWAPRRA